jgi:hypothetical protein
MGFISVIVLGTFIEYAVFVSMTICRIKRGLGRLTSLGDGRMLCSKFRWGEKT